MQYFVIIGDIIQSKEAANRYDLQQTFAQTLNETQLSYGNQITSPLTLTIGDEFQAILTNADKLFDMLYEIESPLGSVSLRYGLGVGKIDTEINRESSIGMDGPAFHLARRAVETARLNDNCYFLKSENIIIERRLNTLFNWIDVSSRRWSKKRKEILFYYRKKWKQQQIAKIVGMSQPAVSQNINDPNFKLIYQTQKLIQSEINYALIEE